MNKKIIIPIICIVFVALAGTAVFFASQNHFGNSKEQLQRQNYQTQRSANTDNSAVATSGQQPEGQSTDLAVASDNSAPAGTQAKDESNQSVDNGTNQRQGNGSGGVSGNTMRMQRFNEEGFGGTTITIGNSRMMSERMEARHDFGTHEESLAAVFFLITVVLIWTILVLGIISLFKYLRGK